MRWFAIALGAVAGLCILSLVFVAPTVYRAAGEGRTALIEGSQAVLRRDAAAARVEFSSARELFSSAEGRLRSPIALPLRIVPVVRTHIGVARSLGRIGSSVAEAGVAIADTMADLPDQSLVFRDGRVDLDVVRRASDALAVAARGSAVIDEAITDMPAGWVSGPLAEPRRQARDLLPSILDGVRKAEAALGGLPSILADGGRKRYLVAFSNLSELRGSGGFFGYVTALEAEDGDLDLEDLSGRPTEIFPPPGDVGLTYPDWFPPDFRQQAEIFQNINMTTDFPTVGSLVLQTAEAEAGQLDGVIGVDPIGIAAVLGLTGPIEVPTWPQRITAENVAKIAIHDVYVAITDGDRREAFFEQLVRTAFDKLTSAEIRLSAESAGIFDRAVRGGHFRMFSEHEADQTVFDRIGASGNVYRTRDATDVLSIVSENAAGNKIDWYLRRDIRYLVALDPDSGAAVSSLSATFRNTAPPDGLPEYIIGAAIDGLPRGTSRQIVLVVRPGQDQLGPIIVDGDVAVSSDGREGDLHAYRTTVDIGARSRSQLLARSYIPNAFTGEGDDRVFRLHVMRQPVANPDFAEIQIAVPNGWKIVGQDRFLGDLEQDVVLEVRVRRTVAGNLIGEPVRLVKQIFNRLF